MAALAGRRRGDVGLGRAPVPPPSPASAATAGSASPLLRALALRAALFLRAHVRALDRDADTRVLGRASAAGAVPEGADLAAASGPAFEISGRGLDDMPRAAQFAVAWAAPPPAAVAGLTGAIFALSDEISRLWTARQAETLIETLAPGDPAQREIADKRGVSQQAIAKRLERRRRLGAAARARRGRGVPV